MKYKFESAVYLIDALETCFNARESEIDWFFQKLDGLELSISHRQLVREKAKAMLLEGTTPQIVALKLDMNVKTVYYLRQQLFKEATDEQQ